MPLASQDPRPCKYSSSSEEVKYGGTVSKCVERVTVGVVPGIRAYTLKRGRPECDPEDAVSGVSTG